MIYNINMVKIIIDKIIGKHTKSTGGDFFDLSSKKQGKIIERAAKMANREQKNLVDKYDKIHSQSRA